MLSHFDKLQTTIKAAKLYPSLKEQASRFLANGWPKLKIARNLWDLWSDDAFTPPALRRGLDAVEPFDEWEEFALFGGHYFLLVASNADEGRAAETFEEKSVAADASSMRASDAATISVHSWKDSSAAALTPRRFPAAFSMHRDRVAYHGGQGTQARLADMDLLECIDAPEPYSSPPLSARMCHTITRMVDDSALLVGGRASPTQALADCWLIKRNTWTKVDDLAIPRYRHCAVSVTLDRDGSQTNGVLVFGGKASDGTPLDDCCLWTANNGWHSIAVDGPLPAAQFGAAMAVVDSAQTWGLLLGGMGVDGTVVEDVWEWSVIATPTPRLKFTDRTNDVRSSLLSSAYSRIGASLVPWENSLLLIGGVSKKELHSRSEDFLLLSQNDTEIVISHPGMHFDSSWPLLVGMGVVSVSQHEILVAGGGAVCFSMGSFWNKGYFSLTPTQLGAQGARLWRMTPRQVHGAAQAKPTSKPPQKKSSSKASRHVNHRTISIPRVQLQSAEDFSNLVATSKPAIIEGLNLGPCTELWSLPYLKEKIGSERELVVHECSSDRMTFKDKNFKYVKKTVADFLDGISEGSPEYLRAISSSQPNKLPTRLEDDFPTIAADFQLPEIFSAVKNNYHSSPLRISGPVSLWLHYDVLSNILCQISGSKTLHLYPPSDVKYLDFPPGGSSSNTDVLTSKDPKLRRTHPHIASLKQGDILFLPPMWSHTATPEEEVSVAVNVFWRDLDRGYAVGKDVYGNRDLQAYENGRRDVEKIIRAFRDIPSDMAGFYLDRLAGEIGDKAEKLRAKKEQIPVTQGGQ